jgi:heme exporter protein B
VNGPRVAWAVLRKDLLLDLRSRDRVGHMLVFSALVVVLLALALPRAGIDYGPAIPALLWIVFLFTALLGLARSFQLETEGGAIATVALAPCDRGWVFAGKASANLCALLGVELWTAALAVVFLDVRWGEAGLAALGVGALGAFGLSAIGTLLSALSAAARFREFLLPVLLFPLILPVLVLAARILGEALAGGAVPGTWWGALALYDVVFGLIGYFTFDWVLEE